MFKITLANTIHNNKYNYDKVVYNNVDTKVIIGCPIHGDFQQTPYHHINRKQGCGQCKGSKIQKTKRMNKKEFIYKANKIHSNKYIYDSVEYFNAQTKITITCKKHGDFQQTPNNHLYGEHGCPNCGKNTSRTGDAWLASFNNPNIEKEQTVVIENTKYKVDGLDKTTNTIYEYFGNFYHGNPEIFSPEEIHPRNKRTFGELYQETMKRIQTIENSSYNFIYTWGR